MRRLISRLLKVCRIFHAIKELVVNIPEILASSLQSFESFRDALIRPCGHKICFAYC